MDPAQFVDRTADERLLGEDAANLPPSVGSPLPLPEPSAASRRVVGAGAAMTGTTLFAGVLLVLLGLVDLAPSSGGAVAIGALVLGVVLLATHWGWVHVAEITSQAIDRRHNSGALEIRRHWLSEIKPYTRYEIATSVDDDGSIRISRTRYEPVRCGDRGFTFKRTVEHDEPHSPDEPGAVVTERAELLRRQAASDTERERERFQLAADAYDAALMDAGDEQQRQAARRAASEALSEQINANLREPPLVE